MGPEQFAGWRVGCSLFRPSAAREVILSKLVQCYPAFVGRSVTGELLSIAGMAHGRRGVVRWLKGIVSDTKSPKGKSLV